jgi:hypothetical protein
MGRRAANVSKADLERAASVAKAHGMAVEILPDGTIKLVPHTSPEQTVAARPVKSF